MMRDEGESPRVDAAGSFEPEKLDPLEAREAEALWGFKEKLFRGEDPDPAELVRAFPESEPRLQKMMALLYAGRAVLASEGTIDQGPCEEGTVLGDYRILKEIGRGGMGVVYLAEQLSLKRPVALKVLPRILSLDSEWLKRFQREACIAATLHHTNIVPVHDFGMDQGVAYYSMEVISGPSLDRILSALRAQGGPPATAEHLAHLGGPVEEERGALCPASPAAGERAERGPSRSLGRAYARKAAWLIAGAAEGLHLAHQRGIIHRDVKPANLMLSASGHLLLTDFGVARMRGPQELSTGLGLGTLNYMSPEQAGWRGGRVDHRSDVYSLGAALFELLTLSRPFSGGEMGEVVRQVLHEDPPLPSATNPWLPSDLEAIVLRAMEKSPARRYQTAVELANDLRRFVLGEPVLARRPGPVRRFALRLLRHWKSISALSAFLAAALLGTWFYLEARNTQRLFRRSKSEQLIQAAEAFLAGERVPGSFTPVPGQTDGSGPLDAEDCLTEALRLVPGDGRAHFLRGDARFETGQLERAVADFTDAIQLGVEVGAAYYRRGMALGCLDRTQEAERDMATAQEIAPADGLLLFYRGVAAQSEGRIPEALGLFQHAFQRRPSLRPLAFYRLALCHHGAADYQRAVASLRVVIGLRPRWIPALSLLARVGFELPDPALVDEVTESLQALPQNDQTRSLLSACRLFRGDAAQARGLLREMKDRSPWDQAQLEAFEAERQGGPAAEEPVISRYLENHPQDSRAWHRLANLRQNQGRHEEALAAFRESWARGGERGAASLHQAARSLIALDRYEEAAAQLDEALEKRRRILSKQVSLAFDPAVIFPFEPSSGDGRPPRLRGAEEQNPRIELGGAYRALGRLRDSRRVLETAALEHPRSAHVRFELGATLFALGEAEPALRELEEAKRLGEDSSDLHFLLGEECLRSGRTVRAGEAFEKARRLAPAEGLPLWGLSRLQEATRREEEALATCRLGIKAGLMPWAFHCQSGCLLARKGSREEAKRAFEECVRTAPAWAAGDWHLGTLALEAGEPEEAERHFRSALTKKGLPPRSKQSWIFIEEELSVAEIREHLAHSLLSQGKTVQARQVFAEQLQAPADSPAVASRIALALFALGRAEDAAREALSAETRWPTEPEPRRCSGLLALKNLRPEAAVGSFQEFLRLAPSSAEAHSLLAQALSLSGEGRQAEEVLRRGLVALPDNLPLSYQLGGLLIDDARNAEASALYRGLIDRKKGPIEPALLNNYLWAQAARKEFSLRDCEEALPLARSLAERAPGEAGFLNTCGLLFLRAGKTGEARELFDRAEGLYLSGPDGPSRGENLLLLSLACSRLGRAAEARPAFAEGSRLAPESPFVAEASEALAR